MKRIITICAAIFITASMFAQAPQKMSYQAVIRNNSNQLITSHAVGMKISVLKSSATGTSVYVETQLINTNENGLVTLEIGEGTVVSGTFASIDWANGPYFIKTETDTAGGANYTITGTSQLLSVPFALYSAKGPANHYIGENYGGGIVFYVYDEGLHGLIAAPTDLGQGIYGPVDSLHSISNAVRDGVGAGIFNTERIIAHQISDPERGLYLWLSNCAAQLCANYQGGGYGDWYLPSKYELNLLCLQKSVVGGFAYTVYWSSTENDWGHAWVQDFFPFGSSAQDASPKNHSAPTYVRAVRAF